jgi:hypothetical protein
MARACIKAPALNSAVRPKVGKVCVNPWEYFISAPPVTYMIAAIK